nr:ATP-binding protein [Maliibacterium massiliense]
MARLTSVHVEKFRALHDVTLEKCAAINLLLGQNDTGKSSLLEAIALLSYPTRAQQTVSRMGRGAPFATVFPSGESGIALEAELAGAHVRFALAQNEVSMAYDGRQYHFTLDAPVNGQQWPVAPAYLVPPSVQTPDALPDALLQDKKQRQALLRLLSGTHGGTNDIQNREGGIHLVGKSGRAQPLAGAGDGVKKLLGIALAALTRDDALLLIDELEVAMHPRMIDKLVPFLAQRCEQSQLQLFISTHSLDVIDAVCDLPERLLPAVAAYRLESEEQGLYVRRFSGAKLAKLRTSWALDVR